MLNTVKRYAVVEIEVEESYLSNDGECSYGPGWEALAEDLDKALQGIGSRQHVRARFLEWEEVEGCQCYRGIEKGWSPCCNCIGRHNGPFCISEHCKAERQEARIALEEKREERRQ